MKLSSKSAEETSRYGKSLGKVLKGGELVCLYGELGGGKTQFTKGLAKALEVNDEVISPTFVFRRDYEGRLNLLHYDFYRLNAADLELIESLSEGLSDRKNVTVIEWAEKIEDVLPQDRINVTFYINSENERNIEVEFRGKKYQGLEGKFRYEVIKCEK